MADSPPSDPDWLTPRQAARVLQLSARRVIQLCKEKRLPAEDFGVGNRREFRISRVKLERLAGNDAIVPTPSPVPPPAPPKVIIIPRRV